MRIKIMVAALVLSMAFVVLLVSFSSLTDTDDGRGSIPVREFTDRSVIVFSDEDFISDVKDILHDSTGDVGSFVSKTPTKMDIVVIDEFWLAGGGTLSSKEMRDMLMSGVPLIFVNDSSYLCDGGYIELLAAASADNYMVYGAYYDSEGCTTLFVLDSTDLEESLIKAYYWADGITS